MTFFTLDRRHTRITCSRHDTKFSIRESVLKNVLFKNRRPRKVANPSVHVRNVFSRIGAAGGLRTIPIDRSRPDGYEEVDWYRSRPGVLRRAQTSIRLWPLECTVPCYIITSNVMLHRCASKDPVATGTTGTRRTGKQATGSSSGRL